MVDGRRAFDGTAVFAEMTLVAWFCVPEASALRAFGFGFEAPAMFQHRRGCLVFQVIGAPPYWR
jgi:hypothetical protein